MAHLAVNATIKDYQDASSLVLIQGGEDHVPPTVIKRKRQTEDRTENLAPAFGKLTLTASPHDIDAISTKVGGLSIVSTEGCEDDGSGPPSKRTRRVIAAVNDNQLASAFAVLAVEEDAASKTWPGPTENDMEIGKRGAIDYFDTMVKGFSFASDADALKAIGCYARQIKEPGNVLKMFMTRVVAIQDYISRGYKIIEEAKPEEDFTFSETMTGPILHLLCEKLFDTVHYNRRDPESTADYRQLWEMVRRCAMLSVFDAQFLNAMLNPDIGPKVRDLHYDNLTPLEQSDIQVYLYEGGNPDLIGISGIPTKFSDPEQLSAAEQVEYTKYGYRNITSSVIEISSVFTALPKLFCDTRPACVEPDENNIY